MNNTTQHNGWLAGSTMLSFNSLITNYWKQIKLPPIHQYFLGKNITCLNFKNNCLSQKKNIITPSPNNIEVWGIIYFKKKNLIEK
jgi:hypothetical protein